MDRTFDPGMRERVVRHDEVGLRLPPAIAAGTVARWTDDELGVVGPSEFIPVAEQAGLINALGTHVLRTACADASAWPDAADVSVDLSPSQLEDADRAPSWGGHWPTRGFRPNGSCSR